MDTCLPTQDPLRLAWSTQAWFIGPRGLPLFLLCLWHPLSYRQRILILQYQRERERERNGSCQFSSFNWDFAALSVTKSLRGQHQTKEKTFHILLSFTTESSYLFLPLSIFFFMDFSHILPTYPSLGLCSPLFLCFKKFDKSTTQHKKHTKMKIKAETQKPQSRRHFETVRDQLYYAEEKDHTSRRTSRPHPERTRMYRIKKYSTNYIHIISIGWYSLRLL